MTRRDVVLETDRPWPDDVLEREVLEAAGYQLVSGPPAAAAADVVTDLVARHQPVAILTCWAAVTAAAIAASPALRMVGRMGVGLDNIDVPAASQQGVLVTNVPDYCVDEVSDSAVGMVLDWTRGLHAANGMVRAGTFDLAVLPLRRLRDLTCGIVGYGRIGRATAGKLAGFGCRILANSAHRPVDAAPAEAVELDELLGASDVVILHVPLTAQTTGLIGAAQLARMKPGSLLVNVSRGALVDIDALAGALATGHLSAAALDVWSSEPDFPEQLRRFDSVLLTPHTAFSSAASLAALRVGAAQEVVRVLGGAPAAHACNSPLLHAKDN